MFYYIATETRSYFKAAQQLNTLVSNKINILTANDLVAILEQSNIDDKFTVASALFGEKLLRKIIIEHSITLQAWTIIIQKNPQKFLKHVTPQNFLTIANADSAYLKALLCSGKQFLNLLAATLPETSAARHLSDLVREGGQSVVDIIVNSPEFILAIADDPTAVKLCYQAYPSQFLKVFRKVFPKKSLTPSACLNIAYTDPSLAYLILSSRRLPLSKENQRTIRNDRITAFNLVLLLDQLQLPTCGQQSSDVLFMVFSYLTGSFLCSPQERDERCQVYDRLLQKRKNIEQRPPVKTGVLMRLFQKQHLITLGSGQQKPLTATTRKEREHVQEAMDAALFAPPPLKEFELIC